MECLVCYHDIKCGEEIFWGTSMVCCGDGECDCEYSRDREMIYGAIHLSCLGNSVETKQTPDRVVNENVKEISVQRSDALSLFD